MSQKFRFLVEGDSWHCLPKFSSRKGGLPFLVGGANSDISRALTGLGHNVVNLAHWGDTLQDIFDEKAYLTTLEATDAEVFLLCGGGNDLLAGGKIKNDLRLYDPHRRVSDYPKHSFYSTVQQCLDWYEKIFDEVRENPRSRHIPIICHGYAHPIPTLNGHWLGDPMRIMGIEREPLQAEIAKFMIDHYNRELSKLVRQHDMVHYVDLRPVVNASQWHDELHPRREAFEAAARKIVGSARRALRQSGRNRSS